MWKKKKIIQQSFSELALAGYVYDLDPDQLEDALRQLDTMMAFWSSKGIAIGYLLPAGPDESSMDDDSGIPDTAVDAVYTNLAIKLAAGRGKTLTADTKLRAKQGFDTLLGAAARAAARQVPMPNTMPRGAGNKPWRGCGSPFFPGPADTLDTTTGGDAITVS
jgi:hypothetical protein